MPKSGGSGFSVGGSSHFGGVRHSVGGSSHFGSRSSFSGGYSSFSSAHHPHRPWYGPRVVVFGGRQIYLGSGRASASSILGVLIVIAIIVTAFLGFSWSSAESDIKIIQANYDFYQKMAKHADEHPEYQCDAEVFKIECNATDKSKCRIQYRFIAGNGEVNGASEEDGYNYSFYVYDEETALALKRDGVRIALDKEYSSSDENTDSTPLSYKDTVLEDDAEYQERIVSRKSMQIGTGIMAGVTALLIFSSVLVRATASKATAEQIAADKAATATNADNKTTPEGTWRCEYCNAINDNSKDRCDGCGAQRQK